MRSPPPFPSLRGWPLLGNLPALRRDPMALLERLQRERGDVAALHLGPRPLVVVADPRLARTILTEQADAFEKGPVVRDFAAPLLGQGLIAAPNALHRQTRRLVQPGLLPKRMQVHAGTIQALALDAAHDWQNRGTIEVAAELGRLFLRILGRVLLSVDLESEAPDFTRDFDTVLQGVSARIHSPWLVPWLPTPGNARFRQALARLDGAVARLIEARKRGPLQDDLLGGLLAARDEDGQPWSDRQLRDEIMTLLVAGHETSAHAVTWALHLLTEHPDQGRLLHAEVDALDAQDPLPRLEFARQVLQEAMRLYPPVHGLGRQAVREVALGPHVLPRGGLVLVSLWLLHRDARWWPEPLAFDPQRFQADRSPLPYTYLPFGAGPRTCAGLHLALLETTLVLATLWRHCTFTTVGPALPQMGVTLRPRGGLWLHVQPR
jgi:cytochrome P450